MGTVDGLDPLRGAGPPERLLGRDAELSRLRSVLTVTPLSPYRCLLIRGDPGIGKSALLRAGRRLAGEAGIRVLTTYGVEAEARMPFAGLHQLVGPLLPQVEDLPAAERAALRTSFGLADGRSPEWFLFLRALSRLLARAAADVPTALFADDLQWVDQPSREALYHVARDLGASELFLVAAVRTGHPTRALPAAQELGVPALPSDAADLVLTEQAPGLPVELRQVVLDHAVGNPLALKELPATVLVGDAVGSLSSPLSLSARLEKAFSDRYVDLPAPARDGLLVAAVDVSGDLDEVLAATARLGGLPATLEDLRPAEEIGLVTIREQRVTFFHPLVRSGVVQRETLARRQAAHAALAEVLGSDRYRRTWHRAQSIVGPDDDVASALDDAAAISFARGAVTSAVECLERAAQLTTCSAARGHRLLKAAEHAFDLGRADLVQELVGLARHEELTELDGARLNWLREVLDDGRPGDAARVLDLCEWAVAAATGGDPDLALNLLLGAALRCWWADSGPRARARVVAVTARLGLTDDPRHVAILAVAEPVLEGRTVSALLGAPRLRALTRSDGDGLRLLGMAAHAIGDCPQAATLLDAGATLLREQGRLGLLAQTLSLQTVVKLELGDLPGARRAVEEALRLAQETGQPLWSLGTLVCAARVEVMEGHTDRALALAARAELAAHGRRLTDLLSCVAVVRGLAHMNLYRHEAAFRVFRSIFDPASPSYHQRERFDGLMFLAETAVASGHRAEGRTIVADLERVAAASPAPLLQAHLSLARAVLADDADAEGLYRQAFAQDLSSWPWVLGRVELAFGRWLEARARTGEARAAYQAAHAIFAATRAAAWARDAEHALATVTSGTGAGR